MKKVIQWFLIIVAAAALSLGVLGAVFVGGANRKILQTEHPLSEAGARELQANALDLKEFEIPERVKILGLGEYTHGSHGPQILRREFLEMLYEKGDLRTVVLEMPFTDGRRINAYIQGKSEKSLAEIMGEFRYFLYQTEEMRNFFSRLRELNEQGADIRFYGVDMQEWDRPKDSFNELLEQYGSELRLGEPNAEALRQAREFLEQQDLGEDGIEAELNLKVLEQYIAYAGLLERNAYQNYTPESYDFRDRSMADNVLWLSEQEGGRMLLMGHNGHIRKTPKFSGTLGYYLDEAIGEDYYAVANVAGKSRFKAVKVGLSGQSGEDRQVKDFSLRNKSELGQALGTLQRNFLLPLDIAEGDLRDFLDQEHAMLSLGATFGNYQKVMAGACYERLNPLESFDAIYYFQEDVPYSFIPEGSFAENKK